MIKQKGVCPDNRNTSNMWLINRRYDFLDNFLAYKQILRGEYIAPLNLDEVSKKILTISRNFKI